MGETNVGLYTMSALPPKADMARDNREVRFVPKADSDRAAHALGKAKPLVPS